MISHCFYHCYFFFNCLFSINCLFFINLISILFKSLWKNSLRTWGGCPHPLGGLHSGGCRPVFSVSRVLQSSEGNCWRHRGHLPAFRLVCNLRLRSSELRSWSSSCTLKRLLGQSVFNCSLLFLFSLFRISVDLEIRRDSQGCLWETVPHMHRTSWASTQYIRPTEWAPSLQRMTMFT